ncbi:MAG: immune inhibitor A, partial [Nocardioides sp.]|nr:immune inhibitor A [Nocardioides sp.]
ETVRLMLHDYNGAQFPTDTHGLAWELGQVWYHGSIWSPVSFGHTGFTGTTIVVDPIEHQTIILLCNRVHPDRNWGSNNPSRRAVADDLGLATPVKPRHGSSVWFSNRTDKKSATLDVPLAATSGAELAFDYWYDTEPLYDFGYLQTSTDGTTFTQLPFHLEGGGWSWDTDGSVGGYGGRTWLRGSVALPDGTTTVRWVYKTDSSSEGRGIRVGDVTVTSGGRTVYSSLRPADAAKAALDGWSVV